MRRSFLFTFAKTVSKSFFSKPATLMYPRRERVYSSITRGKIYNDIDSCIFCGMCMRKCPTHAITVTKETKEFDLRSLQCIACSACVEVCPKKCLTMENHYSLSVFSRNEGVYHCRQTEKKDKEAAEGA